MRPDVVAVVAPDGQLAAGICQAVEDLFVQAFVAQTAVEAFDVAILLWFSGVDVVPFDAVVVGPLQDRLAGEPGAIVTYYTSRFSIDPNQGIEFSRHPGTRDAGIGNQAEVFAAAIIIDRQDAEFSAGSEGVGHKIQGPALVGP